NCDYAPGRHHLRFLVRRLLRRRAPNSDLSFPALSGESSNPQRCGSNRCAGGYWIANRNRMLPISIILVSAEVGQARLRVTPGDDSIMGVNLIEKCSSIHA